jgi:hypothetical protein
VIKREATRKVALYVETDSGIKIPRLLSQATASNHSSVFTSSLLLSEGRAGEAWEPSNKRCSFSLPTIKVSLFPGLFTLIYSSTILPTSLSLPQKVGDYFFPELHVILSFHVRLDLPSGLFPSGFPAKTPNKFLTLKKLDCICVYLMVNEKIRPLNIRASKHCAGPE